MTTLAAFQGNGFAIIGADSRATDDNGSHIVLSNPKVMWDDEENYLFAITGATRGGNLVQQVWVPPEPPAFQSIHKLDQFMTQIFIAQMRDHFITQVLNLKPVTVLRGQILHSWLLFKEQSTQLTQITVGIVTAVVFMSLVVVAMYH